MVGVGGGRVSDLKQEHWGVGGGGRGGLVCGETVYLENRSRKFIKSSLHACSGLVALAVKYNSPVWPERGSP